MIIKAESIVMLWWVACATADIVVYSRRTHIEEDVEFADMPAKFGKTIPPEGLRAFLIHADPPDACNFTKPPPNPSTVPNFTGRWAVLIKRFGCSFEEKIRNAQDANYQIAIVYNINSSELVPMSSNNPDGINIAAVFVGEQSGLMLNYSFTYEKGYYIRLDDESPFDINTHLLLPFAIVVGLCFCTMLGFMVVKCIKDYRRARRHRLPSSSLRKIPIAKFRKGDPYETCAICLEDFIEEEKLRILPCSHAYHCKCVDPWLTRNRRVCPVCKRKVFAADEVHTHLSDSDSDSEVDDRTPLVRSSGTTTQGGTFTSPFLRRLGSARRHSASDAEGSAGPSNSAPSIQNPDETEAVAEVPSDIIPRVITNNEAPNPFEDV